MSHFKMRQINGILLAWLLLYASAYFVVASPDLKLPHQHPNPESVAQEVQWRLNQSISRRRALLSMPCLTGNPIDDCWRCDPNWETNRQHLADCGIGFGQSALGGRGGQVYVVTDPSDGNPGNPTPGTLRYGAVQPGPLWIIFAGDMQIKLSEQLLVSSYKTIDGRGADVHIAGGPCITINSVTNVIVHNVHIHHCLPKNSDGDGISIKSSSNIWVDHCSLSDCADGLIDVTVGSTAVTISNNYFSHHDKVMLLGHSDDYDDTGMQVTVAFNRFGEGLGQRMPRCRHGYFHVVNNDYQQWELYAIGGSANPTINSQGNRFIAPSDPRIKEVTRREDSKESEWRGWNWRSDGDVLLNGAFFVPSGEGMAAVYAKASSVEPRSAAVLDQLTMLAGVTIVSRDSGGGGGGGSNPPPDNPPPSNPGGEGGGVIGGGGGNPGGEGGGVIGGGGGNPGGDGGGVIGGGGGNPGGDGGGGIGGGGNPGGDGGGVIGGGGNPGGDGGGVIGGGGNPGGEGGGVIGGGGGMTWGSGGGSGNGVEWGGMTYGYGSAAVHRQSTHSSYYLTSLLIFVILILFGS